MANAIQVGQPGTLRGAAPIARLDVGLVENLLPRRQKPTPTSSPLSSRTRLPAKPLDIDSTYR